MHPHGQTTKCGRWAAGAAGAMKNRDQSVDPVYVTKAGTLSSEGFEAATSHEPTR